MPLCCGIHVFNASSHKLNWEETHLRAEEEDEYGGIERNAAACGKGTCFGGEQARDARAECVLGCII